MKNVMLEWLDILTQAGVAVIIILLALLALAVLQPFVWPMD